VSPYGIKVKVSGRFALFTRPEMKVERVSYDIITPSASRGIIEAIYWKPSIRYHIDFIHVINPIKFMLIKRNEVSKRLKVTSRDMEEGKPLYINTCECRQQRSAIILKDVEYIIEAHFDIVGKEDNNPGKHLAIFERRARKGQCFRTPYLGCREFTAHVEWCEKILPSKLSGKSDLGYMLYDIDFDHDMTPHFFRCIMNNGIVDCRNGGVL